jgi:outer membrane protein TolC
MTRIALLICFVLSVESSAAAQPAPIRLSLADAVARGQENSHRIAEARAREAGAKAAVTTASLADRPVAGGSAGYTRTNHVIPFEVPRPDGSRFPIYPDMPDNFLTRVAFQWPIFTSGRSDALERAAEAEARAAGADIETARADLRFEIVRAYWAAVTARETVRVFEESSARAEKQLIDARQRFDVGLIPPNEVASLEAQRARERAQLIEAGNLRESALIELRRLIGADPETVIEPTDSIEIGTPIVGGGAAELIKQALDNRAERRALTFRLGGAEERAKAALSATRPTIAISGGFDYAKPNPKIFPRAGQWQDSWDVGVAVNWNFFDFGKAKSQAAEVAAVATATRERIAEFDSVVSADVRQRLLDLDSSQAMVRAATDAVTAAAEARRVITDRYAAGVATSTDVLVAQVALLENELTRTRALANVRLAEARLERSLGR